ncbi:bacteriohemerythrin [Bdellovibrio sp. HCB209]|uniref:bacteriohemerythrin n=1 Tax=Bdellovibrio sp. HCB209 TaxID=3394354 RepID=UPI0039B682D9
MSENFFKWDQERLTTHVDAMDNEHKKLIEIMNRLHDRYEAKAGKAELGPLVKELGSWTVTHFQHEERFFDTLDYPQASVHKKIHKDLLERFTGHAAEFEKTGHLTPEFFQFLKTWLTAHIMGIDHKYGEVAHKKSA